MEHPYFGIHELDLRRSSGMACRERVLGKTLMAVTPLRVTAIVK